MAPDSRQSGFPLATVLLALTALATVLYAVAALAVPMMFGHPQGALLGVSLMAAIAWASLLLSVTPVAAVSRLGLMPLVYAYFFGAAMRFVVVLVALALLVKGLGLPAGPVAVTLAWTYIPLLFLEAGLVGRHIWSNHRYQKTTGPAGGKEALA